MELIKWNLSDWAMIFLLVILQAGWYNIFFMSIFIMLIKILFNLKKVSNVHNNKNNRSSPGFFKR